MLPWSRDALHKMKSGLESSFLHNFSILAGHRGDFQKLSLGSETLGMTYKGMWVKFVGYFADMCAQKFPLVSMGG